MDVEGRTVTSIVLWLLPPPSLLQVIKNWRLVFMIREMNQGRVEVEVGRVGRR